MMIQDGARKKPWYRLRNLILGALALFVLLLGWAFFEVWKVYTGEPKVTRDYRAEFRRLSEKAAGVPEGSGDEAWAMLVEVSGRCADIVRTHERRIKSGELPARVIPGDDFDNGSIDFNLVREGETLPVQIEREREAIQLLRDAGIFARLGDFAKQGTGFRTGDNSLSMIDETIPELSHARILAEARTASMRLAMSENDVADVCAAFDQLLSISHTMSHQPPIIAFLVALAIDGLALSEIRHLLMEFEFDERSCRQILASITNRPVANVGLALEGERAFFHDFVQRFYTDDGRGNGYAVGLEDSLRMRNILGAAKGRFILASRKETLAKYDQYIDGMIEESKFPATKRWANFDPNPDVRAWGYRHAMLAIMLPALQKVVNQAGRSMQIRDTAHIMIALELFHALHRRWPSSLDEMVPSILPEVPRDPINDQPFGYRLLENDPHDRPYLLYSFGSDGHDNGGKVTDNELDDYVRRKNPLQSGFDDVMNVPRPRSQLEPQAVPGEIASEDTVAEDDPGDDEQ